MMIWATAKSTEVSRRHRPHPDAGEGVRTDGRVEAAETTAGVAMSDS